ncbi:MAG: DUF349 domain-containing protein [Balneolales bacterium]
MPESVLNQNSKASVYLFENESGFVTGDSRLVQKDNAFFKGRELGKVNPEKVEEAVEHYQQSFNLLDGYVAKVLKMIDASSDRRAQLSKLGVLAEEINQTDAIGDFGALLSKVDERKKVISGGISADDVSEGAPKTTLAPATEGDPADKQENQQPELPELQELVARAQSISTGSDWQYAGLEFENLRIKWEKAPVPENQKVYNDLWGKFRDAETTFFKRKTEHQNKQREKRQSNLEKRQQLLEKLQNLVANHKWQAIDEVKSIQRKWESFKKLPADDAKKQDKEYEALLEVFDKNKIEYLVHARQKEEDNLTGKLAVLDKLNNIVTGASSETKNWDALDKQVEELTRQWKKIGPVPKENSNQIWNKLRAAKDEYYNKKLELNPVYKKELERNYQKMLGICVETEKLKEEKDLALAARQINTLHKKWKKIGPVPQEHNQPLWDRFKAASDEFNKRKEENIDVLRDQEQDNYELKKQLCDQAEALSETEDLMKGAREMDSLVHRWKEVGPVPKNKSGKIWRRFKKAMDIFHKNRRNFFKEQREEQRKNLDEKKKVIEEINKLADHENAGEAIQLVKPLQEKFKQIGFVPIKKKDIIYKEFKQACDVIYERGRSESKGDEPKKTKFSSPPEGNASRKISSEIHKLKKECDKLNDEILHFDDYITFVKPSKKGNQLRDQIQDKIDSAKEKLEGKLQRIDDLKSELDEI